jgi:acyl-[acyl-carrier-protein] desaturase
MPGATMPDYGRNAMTIAKAGIYDLKLHHDEVLSPVLKYWKVFERTDLGARGEQARDELSVFLGRLDDQATKFVTKREEAAARKAERIAAQG